MRTSTRTITLALLAAWPFAASPQIATDGSVGARVTLTGTAIGIPDSLGLRAGVNLLHSFATFNVRTGETATFVGFGGIENIIARVTGGASSTIDGTLRSTIPGSNLFLVNPSGLVFGPGASISVPGSFHASTAHYLRLADGTRVEMRASPGVTLTAAPPAAFGFEGVSGSIALAGAQLRVNEGRNLTLTGGDVWVGAASTNGRTSSLTAQSGTIGVLATHSAGEAVLDPTGLRSEGFGEMGRVTLQDRTLVNVTEGPARRGGGAISIAGSDVDLIDATVESRTTFAAGRGIAISATGALGISGGGVLSITRGAGNAGPLTLAARDITITNGALIDTSCDPGCTTGNGGALTLVAPGRIRLLGNNTTSAAFVVSNTFGGGRTGPIAIRTGALEASGNALIQGIVTAAGTGDGTSITIDSGSISLTGGAQVDVTTRGRGRGGVITVNNAGAIRIEGTRIANVATGLKTPSGFFSNTESTAPAGGVVVSTGSLEVLGGAEISSTAMRGSSAAGGRIVITARESIRVAGTDGDFKSSGIVSNTFTAANAGDVEISADSIEIADDGRVQVQSEGAGRAGTARIRARTMTLSGRGQVSSDARGTGDGGALDIAVTESLAIRGFDSGFFAKTYGAARGGAVSVSARDILLQDNGGFFAGTDGSGNGGDIAVAASRDLTIEGGRITAESRGTGAGGSVAIAVGRTLAMRGGGSITAQAQNAGRGGSVAVSAGEGMTIEAGARISAETFAGGAGGTVTVHSGGDMTLGTEGRITAEARGAGAGGAVRVTANGDLTMQTGGRITAETLGAGAGGSVTASAGNDILLQSGGRITAAAAGSGAGGSIDVRAGDDLALLAGGRITAESAASGTAGTVQVTVGDALSILDGGRITTQALQADGGDITVDVGRYALVDGGLITTAVGTGQGGGGNIVLRAPTLLLRNATITANAFGGPGGNIRIATTTFLPSADSQVTASSALGVDGTITFESPALDPTGELLLPAAKFADAGAILAGRCGPRLAGRASSLVVAPRGSLAEAPDGWRFATGGASEDGRKSAGGAREGGREAAGAPWSAPLACMMPLLASAS